MKFSDESLKHIARNTRIQKKEAQQPVQEFGSTAESNLSVLVSSLQGDAMKLEEALSLMVSFLEPTSADQAVRDTMAAMFPESVPGQGV